MAKLGSNRYGKSGIRLVKVARDGARHSLRDLTVSVLLEGDFEAAHVIGDNTHILPTDTMKNTVYALAREQLTGSIEERFRSEDDVRMATRALAGDIAKLADKIDGLIEAHGQAKGAASP